MTQQETSPKQLAQLREKIIRHFDLEELRTLCADLGVDYADLPSEGRAAKVRELVAYFERQDRIAELVEHCRQLRPNFDGGTAAETNLLVNVPQLPTHALVGRDEMLAALRARLMSGGTVALCALNGLPGVGKTALAVALAHDEQVLAHFSGGVLWAGLGPNPAVDDILNQWADALGVDASRAAETGARAQLVQNSIAQRGPMLLVIDDTWNIKAADALNLACAGCACLLTTRSPALAAEFARQGVPVDELTEDDALALLEQFAPQACQAESADALDLVRAVGRLPLAIILTGRALAAETFAGQPRRIRQAYEWLKDAEERLKLKRPLAAGQSPISLLATIRLSDEAIGDDAARQAFWALGVFSPKPADFSEEAALAVAQRETAVLDRLVDLGLVEVSGVGHDRYTLHQEIANYGRLMQGDDPTARLRHAQYYLDLVNRDRNAWQRIGLELEQIRFAWRYIQTLEVPETSKVSKLDYVWAMSAFQQMRGLWRELLDWYQHGQEAAHATGRRQDEGTLLNSIAWCYDALCERHRALEYYQQALVIWREVGDRAGEVQTLTYMAMVRRAQEQIPG